MAVVVAVVVAGCVADWSLFDAHAATPVNRTNAAAKVAIRTNIALRQMYQSRTVTAALACLGFE